MARSRSGSNKKGGECWKGLITFVAIGIPMTVFNLINGDGGENNKNNQTLSHHNHNLENCSSNDSFSREELIAVVKHLSVDTPEERIHEFNEIKDIGIAAVILTLIAYFYMWCICCRLADFEKQLQSNENILKNNRMKTVRLEALKKIREELEGKQNLKVEDVELEKSPSLKPAQPPQSDENDEVVLRGEFNLERRLVVINTDDLEYARSEDEDQPEINIANSVVVINNTSRPSTPAFERVSSALTALGELENKKK